MNASTEPQQPNKPVLVPIGVTIGLGGMTFVLSMLGYVLRFLVEKDKMAVLWHALKVVPVFMLIIPLLVCAGAYLMNYFVKADIAMRNAWTLGWLLSSVGLLTIMGVYS